MNNLMKSFRNWFLIVLTSLATFGTATHAGAQTLLSGTYDSLATSMTTVPGTAAGYLLPLFSAGGLIVGGFVVWAIIKKGLRAAK